MYYIIYELKNKINNKIYVGYHKTKNLSDGYMGSGKHIKRAIKKYGIDSFEKRILHFCSNEAEMKALESKIVNEEFIKREDTYNIKVGGHGGFRRGVVTINGGQVSKDDFNKNKLSGVCKGKIAAYDKYGNVIQVNKDDSRLNSGELIRTFQKNGLVSVINKLTGKILRVSSDEYKSNPDLISINKNIATAIDANGNIIKVNKNDIRLKSGELKGHTSGKNFKESEYYIYDDIGVVKFHIVNENFISFCKKNNLPWGALRTSYRNNGEPIYKNVGSNKKRLIESGLIKFINWYAIKIK